MHKLQDIASLDRIYSSVQLGEVSNKTHVVQGAAVTTVLVVKQQLVPILCFHNVSIGCYFAFVTCVLRLNLT